MGRKGRNKKGIAHNDEERMALIRPFVERGATAVEIAEALGKSSKTIRHWLSDLATLDWVSYYDGKWRLP